MITNKHERERRISSLEYGDFVIRRSTIGEKDRAEIIYSQKFQELLKKGLPIKSDIERLVKLEMTAKGIDVDFTIKAVDNMLKNYSNHLEKKPDDLLKRAQTEKDVLVDLMEDMIAFFTEEEMKISRDYQQIMDLKQLFEKGSANNLADCKRMAYFLASSTYEIDGITLVWETLEDLEEETDTEKVFFIMNEKYKLENKIASEFDVNYTDESAIV